MGDIFFITILKSIVIYILALFLSRKIGTRFISQMNFVDFVMAVSMGSLIANDFINEDFPTLSATTAFIMFAILTVLSSYLGLKSWKLRKLINSESVTLVKNGIIVYENMKQMKLTINELMMKLRSKDVFHIADVEFAILETDGSLSVLLNSDKRPLTPFDIHIQTTSSIIKKDIIIDGELLEENLTTAGLDKEWLTAEFRKQKIKSCSEIFYAGVDNTNNLYISKKNISSKEAHGK